MTRVGKQTEVISNFHNGPNRDHHHRPQATSEQLRLAKLTQAMEDQDQMRDKVRKVVELTKCSEQQALMALHDCDDQEVMSAVNYVLDGSATKDEWITKQGKKAKRAAAQQQSQDSANGETETDPEDTNYQSDQSSGFKNGRGGSQGRGGFRSSSDQPPRFQGRGGPSKRGGPPSTRRGNKENETNSMDSRDRGRGRGRSSVGREQSERGRFRSKGKKESEFGYWQGGNSNTWDNRMANEVPDPNSSNTWDNRMADHLTTNSQQQSPPQQQPTTKSQTGSGGGTSNEWNNNSTSDEWNQEDTEWNKQTLVFTATNSSNRKSPSPATAIAQQIQQDTQRQANDTGSTSTAYRTGESQLIGSEVGSVPGSVSASSWTQQATTNLKNELGIGKQTGTTVSVTPTVSSSHAGNDQRTAKVEMPFDVGVGHGSMDIQFGFADDLNSSGANLDYSHTYGQRLQNKQSDMAHQNGVVSAAGNILGNLPKETGKQPVAYQQPPGSGTPCPAVVPPHSISPQKPPTAGLSSSGGRPASGSLSEASSSQQDFGLLNPVPNVSVPPPNVLTGLNSSAPNTASWNSNIMTSSLNSKAVTTAPSAKASVPANVYNQAPYLSYSAGLPYLNMYQTAAAAGLPMRPEEMLQFQAQSGMILNAPPFDFSTVTSYLPQVSSVGSSAGSRDVSSFTTVPEVKPLSGAGGTPLNPPAATVAPPPGFTQPSQTNAAQAAQLIAAQQAAHQLSGGYGAGLQLPLLMQPPTQTLMGVGNPSGNPQFQKGQTSYPMVSYDLNEMDLKSGSGSYGNTSQANKALIGGLAGLGAVDPKSYPAPQAVNKNYEAKFGSGVTNTPPPGIGSITGFTAGFAQPSPAFPYPGGYLGGPPMLHSPAGLNYAPAALGGEQRSGQGVKGNLPPTKFGSYGGNWNNGQNS